MVITVKVIDILHYTIFPKEFADWFSESNIVTNFEYNKKEIFDLALQSTEETAFTVLIRESVFLSINAEHKNYRANETAGSEWRRKVQAYIFVSKQIQQKLLFSEKTAKFNVFLLQLGDQHIGKYYEDSVVNTLLSNTSVLVVTEPNNRNCPMIQKSLEYSSAHNIRQVICCGNPLDWTPNYVGKNTRVLKRNG